MDQLNVLAFPCNQFGAQEPGTDAEILEFARSKYAADFPMFAKVEVNGDGACDVYKFLKSGNPDDDGNEDIAWNFTKFLVNRDGKVIKRYAPTDKPESIKKDVESLL